MNSQNGLVAVAGRVKEKGKDILKSKKAVQILLILGLLGMALILFSELFHSKVSPSTGGEAPVEANAMSQEAYVDHLEKRLQAMVESISGAGKVQVMLTLKAGAETVYMVEGSESRDLSRDADGDSVRQSESREIEQTVVMVQQNQNKEALIQMELAPQINGVVVVCSGAENVLVEQRVLDAVTTVLGISTSKVCVVPMME